MTLIDSLPSLLIMREFEMFEDALSRIKVQNLSFSAENVTDVTVSVFETTIRVLGGLLSAHQLATELLEPLGRYEGYLLPLAQDLADRLMPAFNTPTGVPFHKVNLRRGVIKGESPETCPAAGGSFLLGRCYVTLSACSLNRLTHN